MAENGKLPEGEITIDGVILDSQVDFLNPSSIKVTILSRDPFTGENIRLDNVQLKQANPAMPVPVGENQKCKVSAASYESYRKRIISTMEAYVAPEAAPVQNKAIPEHVKIKSQVDAFMSKPSAICKDMKEKVSNVDAQMGLTHKRDDITLIQGKGNGSSPGIIIHQGNGDVCMFDGTGKQNINLNSTNGVSVAAGTFNVGSSKYTKNSLAFAGMSGYENPVGDVLPSGTILTPYPKYLPDITRIMNTILPIMDLIDLGKACMEAKKLIYDAKTDAQRKDINQNIKDLENSKTGSTPTSSNAQRVVANTNKSITSTSKLQSIIKK
jgi:hypothetical protein